MAAVRAAESESGTGDVIQRGRQADQVQEGRRGKMCAKSGERVSRRIERIRLTGKKARKTDVSKAQRRVMPL